MLCQGERCVGELQAALHKPQPYVSQQLRLLRMSRLVACRRCGQFAYYRLADSRAEHVLRRLCPAPPAGCNGSSKPRVAKAVKR
jgi:DNA-binding transcriptional ArsR family regulator